MLERKFVGKLTLGPKSLSIATLALMTVVPVSAQSQVTLTVDATMDIYRAGGYNDGTWFTASPHEPFKLLHFRASAAHGQTVLLFRGQDASFSPVMRRSIDDERLRRIDTENAALAKTRHSQHGATSVKPRVPVCSSG
jgi:hypothetical protein